MFALFCSSDLVLFFLFFRSHHQRKAPNKSRTATPPAMGPAIQALDCEELEVFESEVPVDAVAADDVIDGSVVEAVDAGVGGCEVLEAWLVELVLVDVAISRYIE